MIHSSIKDQVGRVQKLPKGTQVDDTRPPDNTIQWEGLDTIKALAVAHTLIHICVTILIALAR